jgi:hypothetical protein
MFLKPCISSISSENGIDERDSQFDDEVKSGQ